MVDAIFANEFMTQKMCDSIEISKTFIFNNHFNLKLNLENVDMQMESFTICNQFNVSSKKRILIEYFI